MRKRLVDLTVNAELQKVTAKYFLEQSPDETVIVAYYCEDLKSKGRQCWFQGIPYSWKTQQDLESFERDLLSNTEGKIAKIQFNGLQSNYWVYFAAENSQQIMDQIKVHRVMKS
jgi:hypothetical protein